MGIGRHKIRAYDGSMRIKNLTPSHRKKLFSRVSCFTDSGHQNLIHREFLKSLLARKKLFESVHANN